MLRKLCLAGATVALLTGTASAQMPMPSISLHSDKRPLTAEEIEKQKELDRAYNAATRKIPNQNHASDPWGDVRAIPSDKRGH
jgi:hypothetical protein